MLQCNLPMGRCNLECRSATQNTSSNPKNLPIQRAAPAEVHGREPGEETELPRSVTLRLYLVTRVGHFPVPWLVKEEAGPRPPADTHQRGPGPRSSSSCTRRPLSSWTAAALLYFFFCLQMFHIMKWTPIIKVLCHDLAPKVFNSCLKCRRG